MNAVIAAETISFDNAKPDLLTEAQTLAAQREIQTMFGEIDDLLAAGATLEEISEETAMEFGTYALEDGSEDGIAAYQEFRDAGNRAALGDFPELLELSDGGLFALRLDEIKEPSAIPLDKIKDRVTTDWTRDENVKLLQEEAARVEKIATTGTAFSSLSLSEERIEELTRSAVNLGLPLELVEQIFDAEPGFVGSAASDGTVIVAKLDAVNAFDAEDETGAQTLAQLQSQINSQISNDILDEFINAVSDRDGVEINQLIVDQVTTNLLSGNRGGHGG